MNFPVANKVKTGTWVISSPYPWVGHTICIRDTSNNNLLHFKQGLLYFILNDSCSMYGKYFNLPASFHHTLSVDVHTNVFQIKFKSTNFSVLNLSEIKSLDEMQRLSDTADPSSLDLNFSLLHSETSNLINKNKAISDSLRTHTSNNAKTFVIVVLISILSTTFMISFVLFKFKLIGKNAFQSRKLPLLHTHTTFESKDSNSADFIFEM